MCGFINLLSIKVNTQNLYLFLVFCYLAFTQIISVIGKTVGKWFDNSPLLLKTFLKAKIIWYWIQTSIYKIIKQ